MLRVFLAAPTKIYDNQNNNGYKTIEKYNINKLYIKN